MKGKCTPVINASSQIHMHDILFHVIYGCNMASIYELVHASAVRLHSITRCPFLASMMECIAREAASTAVAAGMCAGPHPTGRNTHGPDVIRAMFFLFLNVDTVLKEYVCKPGCVKAFAAAMNIRMPPPPPAAVAGGIARGSSCKSSAASSETVSQDLAKLHSWSMLCTRPLEPEKARRFFSVLRNSVIKVWTQDERLHASDLLQLVKEEYLVS
jgi:hypothetical protein